MLIRASLLKLDPDIRAFTLVGAFLGYFALLERGIETALGQVLDVNGARLSIIGRNMGFDDKVKTLRSLVNFFIHDKDKAGRFDELARRARKHGEARNIVAHTPFRGSPTSDGVEFFHRSANSKLEFPDMDWSIEGFFTRIDDINRIDNDLRAVEHQMSLSRIAAALMGAPNNSLGGLFGLGEEMMKADEATSPPAGAA